MTNENDNIVIGGDFVYRPYYAGNMIAGNLEVKGNFTAVNFAPSGTHRVILSGEQLQTISLGNYDKFHILELKNYSKEGVYSKYTFHKDAIIRNGCRIQYGDGDTVTGYTLNEDYVCYGDFVLADGIMDLNGHTMTVTGDFIHSEGELHFNGGKLVVKGSYRLQNRGKEGENEVYSSGLGRITMENENDSISVEGDFIYEPSAGVKSVINDGKICIGGDFVQKGIMSFYCGSGITLEFFGKKQQTLSAVYPLTVGTFVNKNESGLIVNSEIKILEKAYDYRGNVSGLGNISVDDIRRISDGKWSGSVKLTEKNILTGDFDTSGNLDIEKCLDLNGHSVNAGEIKLSGELNINGGTCNCMRNFTVGNTGRLIMTNVNDEILVKGDMTFISAHRHEGLLSDGKIELCGHFTQDISENFIATGNHTFILRGKRETEGRNFIQAVLFNKGAGITKFHKLILKKSKENYLFKNDISIIADEVEVNLDDVTPPTSVTNLEAEIKDTCTIVLRYEGAQDDSGRIAGYEIVRNGSRIALTSSETYEDKTVLPGQNYKYMVYPYDDCHNISLDSPVAEITTPDDIDAPEVPGVPEMKSRTGSGITICFKKSADNVRTKGYEIVRDGEKIADIKTNIYHDKGLVQGRN
ncbi:MAG: hypothetical protein IIT65_08895, partial [Lachnospiraceae bacterium]|nr:hypothetical protein [Lachnospiraceae bacterium]